MFTSHILSIIYLPRDISFLNTWNPCATGRKLLYLFTVLLERIIYVSDSHTVVSSVINRGIILNLSSSCVLIVPWNNQKDRVPSELDISRVT